MRVQAPADEQPADADSPPREPQDPVDPPTPPAPRIPEPRERYCDG